jgi:hypothetical protein
MQRSRLEALRSDLRALIPYLIAGVIFVSIGVAQPRFMLNWSPAIALLLVVCWIVPATWRRWFKK